METYLMGGTEKQTSLFFDPAIQYRPVSNRDAVREQHHLFRNSSLSLSPERAPLVTVGNGCKIIFHNQSQSSLEAGRQSESGW